MDLMASTKFLAHPVRPIWTYSWIKGGNHQWGNKHERYKQVAFKKLIMSRILDYWEKNLRAEAETKPSLANFKPSFISLASTHPMFTTCSSNVYETNKSTCQAALLSGRFKSDYMSRHWDKENPDGHCVLCPGLKNLGTLEHLLITYQKRLLKTCTLIF